MSKRRFHCNQANKLDEPAPFIPAQVTSVLSLEFPDRAVCCNHIDAVLLEIAIKPITVIGPIAN